MTTVAFNDGWSYRTKASSFSELGGAGSSTWQDVTVPHDAMLRERRRDDLPDGATTGHFPTGAYQYRRTFHAAEGLRGQLVALQFEGVYRDAAVYVNGALAGRHAYGYSEFTVRIDPFLRFGEDNEIVVECRTAKDARWYSGAGIYRPVHLVVKPAVHVEQSVRVATLDLDAELAVLEVDSTVRNAGIETALTRVQVEISPRGDGGQGAATAGAPVTVLGGESARARTRVYVERPRRWDPEDPFLYEATVRLLDAEGEEVDREVVTFGMRTLQVDPRRGLRINGTRLKLRGACVHHDNGVLGAATFAAAEERRVRILKEAGFNAIRSSHNPLSRAMLDACDRHGLLVMDEAFDAWTSSKTDDDYSHDFPQWWERDIEAMVAKDINHPSVILYSIGNEIPETGTPFGGALSRRLAEKVRELDPTRLVTNGINGFVATLDDVLAAMKAQAPAADAGSGGVNTMMAQLGEYMNLISASEAVTRRTEEAQAVLDVAGMNYAESRYEMDRELFPDRVIVGTESFPTRIDTIWDLVERNDHVIGDFTWTGWDYLGEAGIGGTDYVDAASSEPPSVARAYPWLLAHCGDIDITGFRRPASYYREIVFGLRAEPYIAVQRPGHHGKDVAFATPWAWSDSVSSWNWRGAEGKPVRVEVYARADEVALVLDGAEIGRCQVGSTRPYVAELDTIYRAGTLEAVAYSAGEEIGRHVLHSGSGDAPRIQLSASDARTDGDRLLFVDLRLASSDGHTLLDDDRALTLHLEGPVELLGFGSADPKNEETFLGAEHTTYDGRALAVLRVTGDGAARLTATGEGLPSASLTLLA